jgi:hypothetical protein
MKHGAQIAAVFRSVFPTLLCGSLSALEAAGSLTCVNSPCLVELHHGRVRSYLGEGKVEGVGQVVEVGRGLREFLGCREAGESSVTCLTRRRGAPEAPPCPGFPAET